MSEAAAPTPTASATPAEAPRGRVSTELLRNGLFFIEALAIGPLVGGILTMLRSVDGGPAVTPLLSSTPGIGALAGFVILVAASVVGMLDGRFFGPRSGLAGAGVILAWAAMYTGRTDELLRVHSGTELMTRFAVEGIVACIVVVWTVQRIIRNPLHDGSNTAASLKTLFRGSSMVAALGAAVAGGVVAWLTAFHGAKGQTLFAAVLGGIAAGAAAAIVSAGADSKDEQRPADPVLTAALGLMVLAIVGPFTILILKAPLPSAAFTGELFRRSIAQVHAFDWAAGALIGIPMGLGWAGAHAQAPLSDRSAVQY